MTTLSHLSPDVLEVVRDVAKQEDSFLLRAQGVPLRAFTSENAPRIGPRAAFLSSAERHMLEYCRDETAYLFELGLFLVVTREQRPDSTQIATVADPDSALASSFEAVRIPRACTVVGASPESALVHALTSPQDLLKADWRVLARSALSLRTSSSALTNSALAMIRCGMLDESRYALHRVQVLRPGPWPDYYATLGYERFMRGAFVAAASAYERAWRLSNDDTHAGCALLNQWLSYSRKHSAIDTFVHNLDSERAGRLATRLREAFRFSVGRTQSKNVIGASMTSAHDGWSHEVLALMTEVFK